MATMVFRPHLLQNMYMNPAKIATRIVATAVVIRRGPAAALRPARRPRRWRRRSRSSCRQRASCLWPRILSTRLWPLKKEEEEEQNKKNRLTGEALACALEGKFNELIKAASSAREVPHQQSPPPDAQSPPPPSQTAEPGDAELGVRLKWLEAELGDLVSFKKGSTVEQAVDTLTHALSSRALTSKLEHFLKKKAKISKIPRALHDRASAAVTAIRQI